MDPKDPAADVKFLAPEALRAVGGVLLDSLGDRFVDELQTRDTVTGAIFRYCDEELPEGLEELDRRTLYRQEPTKATAALVLDQAAVAAFGQAAFDFYHKVKGFFTRVEGVQGLAE